MLEPSQEDLDPVGFETYQLNMPDSDPFDPNTWPIQTHEFRIYGDDNAQTWAVVDEVDYLWAVQWRWCGKFSRPDKYYLRRAWRPPPGPNELASSIQPITLLLHVEVQKRTGVKPPSSAHRLVDHRNGNSKDCKRSNLRWATDGMNGKNRYGKYPTDLIEACA